MVMMLDQMNDPFCTYFRVNHTAFTIAEYLLDKCSDVLSLIGNIFCFTRARSEVCGLVEKIPALGFHPTTDTTLLKLEEHISNIYTECIMSIQDVHVPSYYFTEHSAVRIFSYLLTYIVLSHSMAIYSLYTVIDQLQPSFEMGTSRIIFWLKKSCRCSHNIQNLRILSLGLVWYNCLGRTAMLSSALVGWRIASCNLFSQPSISQALKTNFSASWVISKTASESCAMNSKTNRQMISI